ncbi:MAG: hypothetical protein A3I10_07705 [Deltaproteobacteria bacterium RIFCSPLOWO2_02_FULL_57_26]|nr:MAG: hypothetical protein A3I10_07705 [Deltaproteobacteria bacterium RIFCSPLOWO2_02_FULL_57_26]
MIYLDLSDREERERAAATFDRNIVVTAGAGTGKTTLLVDRLVHLLLRNPSPLDIKEIVALTFTNKAATEMKVRLRERLESYPNVRLDREPGSRAEKELFRELRSLMERYHLSKAEVDRRSREALHQLERSYIGTIHSFAASLLRLYPLEAGVDPQFAEDEGPRLERQFEESWQLYLDQELSLAGARKEDWKRVLRKIRLEEVRSLAFSLCSETIQLESLKTQSREDGTAKPVALWLKKNEERAAELIQRHPGKNYKIDEFAHAALAVIREFLARGELAAGVLQEERDLLAGSSPGRVKAWSEEDFEAARDLIRVAKNLCQVDGDLARLVTALLVPFAKGLRERFLQEGWISFDGLLVRARNLLRDHLHAREELKRQFQAILVDEFQDTDPLQYEILLYLAERTGRQAGYWRQVELTPGKIFVVGDPKQSIYAFRRADIEAYLEVVQEVIQAQGGLECRLTNNFRSHAGILNVVNGVFERLIHPVEGLQPPYVAIRPPESRTDTEPRETHSLPYRKVQIRRVESEAGPLDSDRARRLEAESLARWLSEEVLGRAEILNRNGEKVLAEPKDVAILLRKLTDVHQYLEPLRRRGVRYVVEGERHFYAAQEVIDAVNLLRVVENPSDRSALVGLLRSAVGGLEDTRIYELHRAGLLDCRAVRRVGNDRKRLLSPVKELYEALLELHEEARRLPVGQAVFRIFSRIPIKLLAAISFNGEQAVANLDKVRDQAELLAREGAGTLKEIIARLEGRVLEVKEESESALAEENVDAVRILSVHKAKGLEFPIVILAGCHALIEGRGDEPSAEYDWSTELAGLRLGEYLNLPAVYLGEKRRRREREEQKRVLYVAMTRAREHLTISCAKTERGAPTSFLAMLEECLGDLSACDSPGSLQAGDGTVEFLAVTENLAVPSRRRERKKEKKEPKDWTAYADLWKRRENDYQAAIQKPVFLTPTKLKKREIELSEGSEELRRQFSGSTDALLIGDLAHGFLQRWDFRDPTDTFHEKLRVFLASRLQHRPSDSRLKVASELEEIFGAFFSSAAYRELASVQILGREIPFLTPWNGQVMEGVIDLLYERDGQLYLADYKTDRIEKSDLEKSAEIYRHQIQIYSGAVQRALKREVAGFKLIFLRLGEALEVREGD